MAKPIALEIPVRDPRRELMAKLSAAPEAHAEAILSAYELLQNAHESGVLELVKGVLGGGDKLIETAVQSARTPEAIRAIRNMMILAQVLGSIDPGQFRAFAGALPEALAQVSVQAEPPSTFGLLNQFRGKHLRRGVSLVNALLHAIGMNFDNAAQHQG